jgi:formate hydrogenlyase transcriptional activator
MSKPIPTNNPGQEEKPIDETELSKLKQELFEKEILLSLNNDIATVRNKKEILEKIQPKIKLLFNTDDIFICRLDRINETIAPFMRTAAVMRQNHPAYHRVLNGHFSIHDPFFTSILNERKPIIFSINEICNWPSPPEYILTSKAAGIAESLSMALFNGAEPTGIITLWAEKNGTFTARHKQLIQKVADLVSVVLANIAGNETIQQWEDENKILLLISNEIASIRSKEDLATILSATLKKYISFNDSAISIYNKERNIYTVYSYYADPKRRNHSLFETALQAEYTVAGNELGNPHIPVVIPIDEIAGSGKKQLMFIQQAGIKEIAVIKLIDGDNLIGLFALFSEKRNAFTPSSLYLIQRISYQVSIAVAKLLVLEDLRNREKEKEILLTISKELTSVKQRKDVLSILKNQFERLSFYNDIVIARVDDNNETFSGFVVNEEDQRIEDPDYPEMRDAHHPFPDGVFEVALRAEKPVVFNVEELAKKPTTLPYIKFIYENGTVEMIGISLRDGYKEIGVLFLFSPKRIPFSELQFNLAQGIGNQLGTVVANILANEKITRQLEEIRLYKEQLEEEKQYLQEEVSSGYRYNEIIGNSPEIQKTFHLLSQVAFANSTVLILGETGTGKELVARAIHNASSRKDKLMVKVNCATLPANLIESELFGHEKGSFTGATEKRIGKFELANNGTLFLDEIGEMPSDLQVKLLRAIQEKEIERIGGKNPIKINVRIIAATNRNLQKEVEEERFRNDLYYRLNVFPITLPALRERKEDIPLLVSHFIDRYAKNTGKNVLNISAKAMKELLAYDWPGNVRELEHLIERSVLMTTGSVIKEIHLPSNKKMVMEKVLEEEILKTHEENEREHIIRVLNKTNGKIYGPGGAAAILNLRVSTLNSKISKLGIKKNKLYS